MLAEISLLALPSASLQKEEIVVDIQYKCDGEFPLSEVQRMTVIEKGEAYSRRKMRKSVEAIYALGHFAQVEVDKEDTPEGTFITFLLTNKVIVKSIEIVGNEDIKDDEILNVIRTQKGEEYDASPERQDKDRKLIEGLYKRNGYFSVAVGAGEPDLDEARKEAGLKFEIKEGKRAIIKEISFPEGLSIKKKKLLDQLKTRQESEYDYQILDKDVDRLKKFYRDEGYLMVRIDEPELKYLPDENRVEILLDIIETPKITVEFEGNDNIKDSKLKKGLTLYKTNDYSDLTLRMCVDDIENLYRKEGYYRAKATYERPEKKRRKAFYEVVITFYIDEGKPFSIKEIGFEGNKAFSTKQLRSQMSTRPKSRFALPGLRWLFSKGIFDEQVFETDLRALHLLYKQHGYRKMKISPPSINPQDDKIVITINIDEGAQTLVKEVRFSDKSKGELNEESLKKLGIDKNQLATQPTKPSQPVPYNRDNVVADTAILRSKYYEHGYVYVKIDHGFDENIVTFDIDKGKQAILGERHFTGYKKTKEYVLRREFLLEPGDVYNRTKLAKTRQRLFALGLFSSVDFEETSPVELIGSDEQDTTVPIDVTVKVEERYAGSVSLRGGYSPSEGIRSTLELGYNNLFGRAWRVDMKARAGTRGNLLEMSLSEPRLFPVPRLFPEGFRTGPTFRLFRDNLEEEKDAMATGGTVSLTLSGGQRSNLALQYKYQQIEQELDSVEVKTTVSSIGLSIRRDARDDFLYPDEGLLNIFSAEYAGGIIRGESSFYKLTNDNRYYRKISNAVLALAIRTGYAKGLRSTKEIVSPERFRTGGSTTIRGYSDWSIGPTDGGDVLFLFNAELRFPIHEFERTPIYKFGGAFFYDTGNVWDKIKIADIPNLRLSSSFGFGFRLNTPIGPIRLDYGFPKILDLSGGKLWLELGHAF